MCLELNAQHHTTGAAWVEGKKVAKRHVPQYVFVPHVRQCFGLQTKLLFCVGVEMGSVGR